MCWATSFSRHFIATDVNATGLKSFKFLLVDIFETGMIVAAFQ